MLLSDVDNILALYITSAVVCCFIEYATSWVMEKIFHARWWDYENRHFNLNGRVCLAGALLFGAGCTVVLKLANPAMFSLLDNYSEHVQGTLALAAIVTLGLDLIVTNMGLLFFRSKIDELCDQMTILAKEKYLDLMEKDGFMAQGLSAAQAQFASFNETYGKNISGKIPYDLGPSLGNVINHLTDQERRIMNAFPKLKATARPDALLALRIKLKESMQIRKHH